MVEVLEYSLVFLASSMLVGFSIAAASSFGGVSREVEDRAVFSGLTATAWEAVEHGNSSIALTTTNSSLNCQSGRLTFTSQNYSGVTDLPVGCEFGYPKLDGRHLFDFASAGGWLELTVS
jgi:hypothetical protein